MIKTPSISEIYQSMKANAEVLMGVKKSGIPSLSFLNILLIVVSGAMKMVYTTIEGVANGILPDRASGWFFDRLTSIYKVPYSGESSSEGLVVFKGRHRLEIPSGTTMKTPNGDLFKTAEVAIIGDYGYSLKTLVRSEAVGAQSNFAGESLQMQTPIKDIEPTATLVMDCMGGSDGDTADMVKQKLMMKFNSPKTLGLDSNYQNLALTVDGCGKVWVTGGDLNTGYNTVVLTIATRENLPVSESTIESVEAVINNENVKLPGIIVGVHNLQIQKLTIFIDVPDSNEVIKKAISSAVANFFRNSVLPNSDLIISQLNSAISGTGVIDFQVYKIFTTDPVYTEYDGRSNITPIYGKKFDLNSVRFE